MSTENIIRDVVSVNGEMINNVMLDKALSRYILQLDGESDDEGFDATPENMKFLRVEVLNLLIERLLVLQAAKKKGIEVSNDAVDANLEKFMAEYETPEEWEAYLKQLYVNSEEELRDEVRKDMIVEIFLNEIYTGKIDITPEKLRDYYDNNPNMMKEPDMFTFYEVLATSTAMVNTIAMILKENNSLNRIRELFSAQDIEFENHTDIPAFQLPEEVLNVLSDLEDNKIATMVVNDDAIMVYQLLHRHKGKKLEYKNIEEGLGEYLLVQGQKEIYSDLVINETEAADIQYLDPAMLENK